MGIANKRFPGEEMNPIDQLKSGYLYMVEGKYENWPDNLIGASDVPWTTNKDYAQPMAFAQPEAFAKPGDANFVGPIKPTGAANAAKPMSGMAIGGVVAADAVNSLIDTKKNLATDEYLMDLDYWKQQGKGWFDKNTDYVPTFEEYAGNQPSASDALKEGSITGSSTADSAIGGAASGAAMGATIGAFAGGIGAAPGALIGGAVGGLVGLIEGIFTEGAADKKDAKEKTRAYTEYKNKLKLWTFQKNEKNEQDRIAKEERANEKNEKLRAIGKTEKEKNEQKKKYNNDEIVNILRNVGSIKNQAVQAKINRWN